jgi:hypothetical protein
MCSPNITADNSATEDIGQSLHRHTCSVGSGWVFLLLLTLQRTAWE